MRTLKKVRQHNQKQFTLKKVRKHNPKQFTFKKVRQHNPKLNKHNTELVKCNQEHFTNKKTNLINF